VPYIHPLYKQHRLAFYKQKKETASARDSMPDLIDGANIPNATSAPLTASIPPSSQPPFSHPKEQTRVSWTYYTVIFLVCLFTIGLVIQLSAIFKLQDTVRSNNFDMEKIRRIYQENAQISLQADQLMRLRSKTQLQMALELVNKAIGRTQTLHDMFTIPQLVEITQYPDIGNFLHSLEQQSLHIQALLAQFHPDLFPQYTESQRKLATYSYQSRFRVKSDNNNNIGEEPREVTTAATVASVPTNASITASYSSYSSSSSEPYVSLFNIQPDNTHSQYNVSNRYQQQQQHDHHSNPQLYHPTPCIDPPLPHPPPPPPPPPPHPPSHQTHCHQQQQQHHHNHPPQSNSHGRSTPSKQTYTRVHPDKKSPVNANRFPCLSPSRSLSSPSQNLASLEVSSRSISSSGSGSGSGSGSNRRSSTSHNSECRVEDDDKHSEHNVSTNKKVLHSSMMKKRKPDIKTESNNTDHLTKLNDIDREHHIDETDIGGDDQDYNNDDKESVNNDSDDSFENADYDITDDDEDDNNHNKCHKNYMPKMKDEEKNVNHKEMERFVNMIVLSAISSENEQQYQEPKHQQQQQMRNRSNTSSIVIEEVPSSSSSSPLPRTPPPPQPPLPPPPVLTISVLPTPMSCKSIPVHPHVEESAHIPSSDIKPKVNITSPLCYSQTSTSVISHPKSSISDIRHPDQDILPSDDEDDDVQSVKGNCDKNLKKKPLSQDQDSDDYPEVDMTDD
jgi:hypothetical protein